MDNVANFKGVMLCNRPVQSTTVMNSQQPSYDSGSAPFVSTVMPAEQLGSNPIRRNLPGRPVKNPADDVTWRHKQWLAEFQERREDLVEMMEDCQVENEEKTKKFQEKQATMRAAIRKAKAENPGDREAIARAMTGGGAAATTEKTQKFAKAAKPKKQAKPKWALTEEANEDVEDIEVDDLLDFTNNLDFEQYMDDLEVKEAMTYAQDRIKELAEPRQYAEVEDEEGEGDEGDELGDLTSLSDPAAAATLRRRRKKEKAEGGGDWEGGSQASHDSAVSDSSNISKSVLSNNSGMRAIHSQASVKAMMEKQQSLAMTEPRVAVSKSRGNVQTDASNLPYLFRSPQI